MSDSVASFAAKCIAAGDGIKSAERVGVNAACLAGKGVMLASMAAAGINGRLSGVGTKGARVGVRYDVRGGAGNVTGLLRYTGPIHLAASGTKPHLIVPRKRRGKRALSPAGNPWAAASAQHPGTAGKPFAKVAFAQVVAQSPEIISKAVQAELASIF